MSIKLVVFDMAGTTVYDENNVAETLQYALAQFGFSVSIEAVNKVMGYPKPDAISELLKLFPQQLISEETADYVYQVFLKKMISFYKTSAGIREKEGVTEAFRQLKSNGIKIGIDTGFSRDIMDVILERMGWGKENLIDVTVASDEVANGRPHPDMIFKAMEATGIAEAGSVVKVGDTVSDLLEGTSAGCKFVIGITTGSYSHEELTAVASTHLVPNINDVVEIVLNDTLVAA